MVKQRENYKIIILEPAKTRIKEGKCPSCNKIKWEWTRRRDWTCCSVKCTEEFQKSFIYYGWADLRGKAFKRDKFTCVKCGFVAKTIKEKRTYSYERWVVIKTRSSQLIGDHIVPIALGGDEWDINNVQTLCIKCDKIKTKQDQGEIAKLRKKEKLMKNNSNLNNF